MPSTDLRCMAYTQNIERSPNLFLWKITRFLTYQRYVYWMGVRSEPMLNDIRSENFWNGPLGGGGGVSALSGSKCVCAEIRYLNLWENHKDENNLI